MSSNLILTIVYVFSTKFVAFIFWTKWFGTWKKLSVIISYKRFLNCVHLLGSLRGVCKYYFQYCILLKVRVFTNFYSITNEFVACISNSDCCHIDHNCYYVDGIKSCNPGNNIFFWYFDNLRV